MFLSFSIKMTSRFTRTEGLDSWRFKALHAPPQFHMHPFVRERLFLKYLSLCLCQNERTSCFTIIEGEFHLIGISLEEILYDD